MSFYGHNSQALENTPWLKQKGIPRPRAPFSDVSINTLDHADDHVRDSTSKENYFPASGHIKASRVFDVQPIERETTPRTTSFKESEAQMDALRYAHELTLEELEKRNQQVDELLKALKIKTRQTHALEAALEQCKQELDKSLAQHVHLKREYSHMQRVMTELRHQSRERPVRVSGDVIVVNANSGGNPVPVEQTRYDVSGDLDVIKYNEP